MQADIDSAAKKGGLDTYYRLRKEMEEVESNKTTIDLSTISTILPSVTREMVCESNDVEFLHASFNELNNEESKVRNRAQLLAAIVAHPALSDEEQMLLKS